MARAFSIFVGLAVVAYYVLNHSTAREAYSCQGELTSAGLSRPETVVFALDRNRWWLFWAVDDGNAYIELSDGYPTLYSGLDESSMSWFFYLGPGRGIPDGIFSALSSKLQFRRDSDTFFKGTCTRTG